jgi:hypothetical protein
MSLFGRSSCGLDYIKDALKVDEEILYVRDKVILPEGSRLVLTNKRIILYPGDSHDFYDHPWRDLHRVWIEKDLVKLNLRGTIVIRLKVPKEDAEIIIKIAKEKLDAISDKSQMHTSKPTEESSLRAKIAELEAKIVELEAENARIRDAKNE